MGEMALCAILSGLVFVAFVCVATVACVAIRTMRRMAADAQDNLLACKDLAAADWVARKRELEYPKPLGDWHDVPREEIK